MRGDRRGRVTLPDVAFLTFAIAMLGALYPIFRNSLEASVSQMSTGTALLIQIVLPMTILVVLYALYRKAIRGAQI